MISGRIEHAIDRKQRYAPHGAPGEECAGAGGGQERKPDAEVPKRHNIRALDELLEALAIDSYREPLPLDVSFKGIVGENGGGAFGTAAQPVILPGCNAHLSSLHPWTGGLLAGPPPFLVVFFFFLY